MLFNILKTIVIWEHLVLKHCVWYLDAYDPAVPKSSLSCACRMSTQTTWLSPEHAAYLVENHVADGRQALWFLDTGRHILEV